MLIFIIQNTLLLYIHQHYHLMKKIDLRYRSQSSNIIIIYTSTLSPHEKNRYKL